jgi:AcrR family transcriptional regulator
MQKPRYANEGPAVASARGRPRSFDREQALTTAMRLFWRKGYSATSMSDLTGAMGIGATSLYAAFGSKEALFTEALQHYACRHAPKIWARFEEATTAREAVEALLHDSAEVLARTADDPAGCMVALSAVGDEGHDELGAKIRTVRADGIAKIRARLVRAEPGELPKGIEADALARYVAAVQGGMSLQARDGADATELRQVADAALSFWDAGRATAR